METKLSRLITGGSAEERNKLAADLVKDQSSKFDVIQIDTQEQRGIEAVRNIIEALTKRPFQSLLTSVIVNEASNLTVQAQNALLKILEEPPTHGQIILTTQSAQNLLPTVVSRCLEIHLDNPSGVETESFIQDLTFGESLEKLEKTQLSSYLDFWYQKLREKTHEGKTDNDYSLKWLHSYLRLIMKLSKGEKLSINKRLIALILALELPVKSQQ